MHYLCLWAAVVLDREVGRKEGRKRTSRGEWQMGGGDGGGGGKVLVGL